MRSHILHPCSYAQHFLKYEFHKDYFLNTIYGSTEPNEI